MICIYISYLNFKDDVVMGDKKKLDKKSVKKDSQLILRLDKEDRDAFVALCKDMDTSAAREIRRFIREFLEENA